MEWTISKEKSQPMDEAAHNQLNVPVTRSLVTFSVQFKLNFSSFYLVDIESEFAARQLENSIVGLHTRFELFLDILAVKTKVWMCTLASFMVGTRRSNSLCQ